MPVSKWAQVQGLFLEYRNVKGSVLVMRNQIICNDVIAALKTLPAKIAQCCITSPPYYSMRSYEGEQNVIWDGDPNCNHEFATQTTTHDNLRFRGENSDVGNDNNRERFTDEDVEMAFCAKCGAWKGALGLEPNPEMYVDHLVQIFREVRRVLRDDGTVWLNIASTYISNTIESEDMMLKDDLTPDEVEYVLKELAKHVKEKDSLP